MVGMHGGGSVVRLEKNCVRTFSLALILYHEFGKGKSKLRFSALGFFDTPKLVWTGS